MTWKYCGHAMTPFHMLHICRLSVGKSKKEGSTSPRNSIPREFDDSNNNSPQSNTEATIGGINVTVLRKACIEACSSLLTIHTHLPVCPKLYFFFFPLATYLNRSRKILSGRSISTSKKL